MYVLYMYLSSTNRVPCPTKSQGIPQSPRAVEEARIEAVQLIQVGAWDVNQLGIRWTYDVES